MEWRVFPRILALRIVVVACALVLGLALLPGCKGCGSHEAAVAQLAVLQGAATRERVAKPQSWDPVATGAEFGLGDALRTGPGATATVHLLVGGDLKLGEQTTVRFLRGGAGGRRLSVETGEAEVEPGGSGMEVATSIGMAEIEAGSRVRLASNGQRTTFDVLLGGAQFDAVGDGGGRTAVKAGQRYRISIGGAGVEAIEPVSGPAPADAGAPRTDAATPRDAAPDASSQPVMAEVHGAGARMAPSRTAALASLAEGTVPLEGGVHLVVPDGTTVELSRGDERVTVLGGSDVDIGAAGGPVVRVASGRVLVKSQQPGTRVRVPAGSIDLVASGKGDVQTDVRVDHKIARVVSNHAELSLRGDARTVTVGPGQSGTIDAKGEASVDEVTPRSADVVIAAGESATVHSPNGVAAVQIRLEGCPGDSLIQITSQKPVRRTFARADDPTTGIVRLGAGSQEYSASCVAGTGASAEQRGTIRVVADAGRARLARTAATNVVDADGRHYHVLYQSLLPQMTFRWPDAPKEGAITFHATSGPGNEKKAPAPAGKVALPAGSLGEGTYRYWFELDGHPDRRSPDTSLVIGFDNAAPAAEIRTPVDGQPVTPTVHVSGVANDGSSVSVSGVAVPLDAQARFNGDVPAPPAEHRTIAVRIAHPSRGIHYFLRTLGAPAPE